jgi:hypothetical protein
MTNIRPCPVCRHETTSAGVATRTRPLRRHCSRLQRPAIASEAAISSWTREVSHRARDGPDCFVATLLAMTEFLAMTVVPSVIASEAKQSRGALQPCRRQSFAITVVASFVSQSTTDPYAMTPFPAVIVTLAKQASRSVRCATPLNGRYACFHSPGAKLTS